MCKTYLRHVSAEMDQRQVIRKSIKCKELIL